MDHRHGRTLPARPARRRSRSLSRAVASPEEIDAFLPVLEHARRYVASALWRWSGAPSLVGQLDRLREALARRDDQVAGSAIGRAGELLASCRKRDSPPGERPDLEVIALVLERAAALRG